MTAECVCCGAAVPPSKIGAHHVDEHPDERYDPIWYFGDAAGGSRYYYLVSPEMRIFDTRHEAVGAAALFERGSHHLVARVIAVERGTPRDDVVQTMLEQGDTWLERHVAAPDP